MRETLVLYRDDPQPPPALPEWAAAVGQVRPARRDELPPGYPRGLRFAVPLVEMPTYLPHLHEDVMRAGGTQVTRRVSGLDQVLDLGPDVIVNAAGMAAGALVGDRTVFPIRGQIVWVENPGLDLSVRDEMHPGGRAYVHPLAGARVLESIAGLRPGRPESGWSWTATCCRFLWSTTTATAAPGSPSAGGAHRTSPASWASWPAVREAKTAGYVLL
jgi:hypothetical protein